MFPRLVLFAQKVFGFLGRRKRLWLLLGICLAVCVLIALACVVAYQREPHYEGVSASEWLDRMATNPQDKAKVELAFQKMGPKGAEYLGSSLLVETSGFRNWLQTRRKQMPAPFRKWIVQPNPDRTRANIFSLLSKVDTNAVSAIPMVVEWSVREILKNQPGRVKNSDSLAAWITSNGFVPPAFQFSTQMVTLNSGAMQKTVHIQNISGRFDYSKAPLELLTRWGADDPRAVSVLLYYAAYPPPWQFRPTVSEKFKRAALGALPLLQQAAHHTNSNVRAAAFEFLQLAAPESAVARRTMTFGLGDKDDRIFRATVQALGKTKGNWGEIVPSAVYNIHRNAGGYPFSPDEAAQGPVAKALQSYGPHDVQVVPEALAALPTGHSLARFHLLVLLGTVGNTNNVDLKIISTFTEDADVSTRIAAWYALSKLTGDPQAVLKLELTRLEKGDERVGWDAVDKLGALKEKAVSAVPQLMVQLENKNMRVVAHAAESLGKIGPVAVEAVPSLQKATKHEYATVRDAVNKALEQILAKPEAMGECK